MGKKYLHAGMFAGPFLPGLIASDPGISPGAKLMYAWIGELLEDDNFYTLGVGKLAEHSGTPESQVRKYVAELKDARLLDIQKDGKVNRCCLLDREDHYIDPETLYQQNEEDEWGETKEFPATYSLKGSRIPRKDIRNGTK